jgi:methionine sulfoxide reductase heme-binding subunit
MITTLNAFLMPVENLIKKYRKYIGYAILLVTLIAAYLLSDPKMIKSSGEKAILVLWIILWMPILARVFGLRLFAQLLPLRKELGILMGVLAVIHGFSFIIPNQELMQSGGAVWQNGKPTFILFGIIAMWLSVPLTLTSSMWAMRKMGKKWKMLHRLIYVIVLLTVVHVVMLKSIKHFEFAPVILLIAYFGFKVLEWRGFSFAKRNSSN